MSLHRLRKITPYRPLPLPARFVRLEGLNIGHRLPLWKENCSLALDGGTWLVRGVNGIGKTTLLRTLAGLLAPKAGSFHFAGPETRPLWFSDCLALPEKARPGPLMASLDGGRLLNYMGDFKVPPDKTYGAMSLGQKQKFTLLFAMAQDCPIELMDEPFTGLDRLSIECWAEYALHFPKLRLVSSHGAEWLHEYFPQLEMRSTGIQVKG